MNSSTNSFSRWLVLVAAALAAAGGCAGAPTSAGVLQVARAPYRIAVFPVENLSGAPVPSRELRDLMVQELKSRGITLLGQEDLERFMEKHRVRYAGGLDGPTAADLGSVLAADAVLITSFERYDERFPPKISLLCRLVSTGEYPSVLWTGSAGLAGSDSPGILGLGIVEDPRVLMKRAASRLADSLALHLGAAGPASREGAGARRVFRPKVGYRSPDMKPGRSYRVAVLPFQNLSLRKNAGEIVAHHFIGQLSRLQNVSVAEPGVIRQEMLGKRIIMSAGVSLADADLLGDYPGVDLIVSGTVFSYTDATGQGGTPQVEFSTQVIDRRSRTLVWASESRNDGDDGVVLFDLGRRTTANSMAAEMVGLTVGEMMPGRKTR